MGKPCAAVRVQGDEEELYLRCKGWWPSDDGWRHRGLVYPWPASDALKVQQETDEGGQDAVHRALRAAGGKR